MGQMYWSDVVCVTPWGAARDGFGGVDPPTTAGVAVLGMPGRMWLTYGAAEREVGGSAERAGETQEQHSWPYGA